MTKHLILSALITLGTVFPASAACGQQSSCSRKAKQTQGCTKASSKKSTCSSKKSTCSGDTSKGSTCSGNSCSESSESAGETVNSADDMDKVITTMAADLMKTYQFESTLSCPGSLVWKTLAGNDHVSCYGIASCGGKHVLQVRYWDAARIIYAYHQETDSSTCASSSSCTGSSSSLGSSSCTGSSSCSKSSSSSSCSNSSSSSCSKSASSCAAAGNVISEDELKAMKIMRERLKEIVNEDMTPEQIVLAIHDDLVNRATYSFKGDCYSATGLILNDSGVCNAYSLYMNVALNMVGIPCHRVVGNKGFNHAWNLVQLNDEWYHVDATWDDPVCCSGQAILRHTYFCVSDATISKDHTWDRDIYPASAKEDLPFSSCGSYASSEECMKAIQNAASGSGSSFEGSASFATDSASFAKALADIASESGAGCPVVSYLLDAATGHFIINFGSPDTDVVPEELQLEKSPVESAESAAKWLNVESPELDAEAQESLLKSLSPDSSKTWEELLQESQDVLTPDK